MTTIYKTINGKQVDMHKLMMQNELTIAVGNMGVNARGDRIGPGGSVLRKSEDLQNTITVPNQMRDASEIEITDTVDEPQATKTKPSKSSKEGE